MKLVLNKRHYGVHSLVKEVEIEGTFRNYAKKIGDDDYQINEQKLIESIPKDFLPVDPKNILLTVGESWGSTGQIGLSIFKNWSKYFDCYSIELCKK